MNQWERRVTQHLIDSEYYFLKDYDYWLHIAFNQIPIGADEHTIHAFHLTVGQRLSSILTKHSIASFTSGQAHGDEDCKAILDAHRRKLADLPKIVFAAGQDFTPHDAIKVLQNRAITLAGEVENDATSGVKSVLLKHLTGEITRPQAEQQIADLLKSNMNRASLIVTTETTYAYNHGRLIQYRSNGVDYVQYRAVMDGSTCQICSSRNGLIAPIDDIGADIPPVHGRCRCVLSPVFSLLQPQLMTPKALNWSNVAPLPKGWVPENTPASSGKIFTGSGLKTGARLKDEDAEYKRQRKHAKVYYEAIRKRNSDVTAIAKNSGMSKAEIQAIKNYVFNDIHDMGDKGPNRRFDPDYEMAVAWQRLIEGKNIKESDRILLNHELYESKLMKQGNNYINAHNEAQKWYNYAAALKHEKGEI
ncbi:minor capsid protein [Desulfosporosinus sp. FKA]|uniref:minor capsid protein n=1 Tax=Desulfosporosinus sp. FKA TaxID=1969834 RepID=UPI000B499162|nr:minor capsid protein [Desulfosporosinus sp. FKA]